MLTASYKKIEIQQIPNMPSFYLILLNGVPTGIPIKTKKEAKAIIDWYYSITNEQCKKAKDRS